jgi:hypothetical protein
MLLSVLPDSESVGVFFLPDTEAALLDAPLLFGGVPLRVDSMYAGMCYLYVYVYVQFLYGDFPYAWSLHMYLCVYMYVQLFEAEFPCAWSLRMYVCMYTLTATFVLGLLP